jgi:[ribosomal protein S5]-alanine N-acetyltransferase
MTFQDGFRSFPVLTTTRLVLREPVPEDAQAYFDGLSTVLPAVWGLRRDSAESTRDFLAAGRKGFRNKATIRWAIVEQGSRRLIGEVKLFDFVYQSKAEIAFWLADSYRRRGYGGEAAGAVVTWGFEVLDLHRIEAFVQPHNAASCGLLVKLGFTREGLLRKFRNEGGREGIWTDSAVFGMLRGEHPGGIA